MGGSLGEVGVVDTRRLRVRLSRENGAVSVTTWSWVTGSVGFVGTDGAEREVVSVSGVKRAKCAGVGSFGACDGRGFDFDSDAVGVGRGIEKGRKEVSRDDKGRGPGVAGLQAGRDWIIEL